ncbi:uncharacterized protein K452DRAFT_362579 [Aplosporella prunicola CBS 121167]|uniref:F-box domain-containing protein n=1 Tax=Aplosporella prunicola CBS 121167 TaxID=1176127 RepID=A0A6A6AYV8_9PEZI|nr:uncharacterized protein K452DRAFT_362579 [Aplosporella prunicola CBS 121167]KAF2136373.1 hypothetical protein K452DRAFT_362579 [Aplosporella prunicola CBS 121167]
MALQLLHLPVELLRRVVECTAEPSGEVDSYAQLVARKDGLETLRSLRLVCKTLSTITTPVLFQTVGVHPSFPQDAPQESVERYNRILEHEELRKHVRSVHFDTFEVKPIRAYLRGRGVSEEYLQSLSRLKEFPNLNAAMLRFSQNWIAGERAQPQQSYAFSRPIREAFCKALTDPLTRDVKHISLQNILANPRSLTELEDHVPILTRVSSFTLSIIGSQGDRGLRSPYIFQHRYLPFFMLLPNWLASASTNLTHLALYFFADWTYNFFPPLELQKVHFPHLHTLALGDYAIARCAHVDWITGHGRTLRRLFLHHCPIIVYRIIYPPFAVPVSDPEGVELHADEGQHPHRLLQLVNFNSSSRPRATQFTSLRWADVFARLGAELPRLEEFRFGACNDDVRNMSDAEVYLNMKTELYEWRYKYFDSMRPGPMYVPIRRAREAGRFSPTEGSETDAGKQFSGFLGEVQKGDVDREDGRALMKLCRGKRGGCGEEGVVFV